MHDFCSLRSGVLAELERSLISERTRAGVKAAQR